MTVIVDIQTVFLQHLGRHLGSIVRTTRVMTMEFEYPPTGTEATGRKHWCKSGVQPLAAVHGGHALDFV